MILMSCLECHQSINILLVMLAADFYCLHRPPINEVGSIGKGVRMLGQWSSEISLFLNFVASLAISSGSHTYGVSSAAHWAPTYIMY